MKAPCVRTVLVIGVLAGLCFSVGEGLRLLPLPHAPSCTGGGGDSRPGMTSPGDLRQNQFKAGSMSLPPQAQKNLRHKQTWLAPASGCALPLPHDVLFLSGAEWRACRRLNASAPGPSGRAPPRAA